MNLENESMSHYLSSPSNNNLNFPSNSPDSVSLLPVSKSTSLEDIREAAKAFATLQPSSSFVNNLCVVAKPCFVECKSQEIRVLGGDNIENMNNNDDASKAMFYDEEVLFNMPGFLDSMAEGLLITPPSMKSALDWDDVDCEMDLTLWTE
ncbi:dehydration-responsive element-binding protein 1F [Medicago truncatula]|uniref:CBF/DREB1 transcription factor n=1 Tax=Medicago truncatula TaxID=3880 RepID=A0A072VAA9_MEDTR|nr:dehydration-responsive element-binding protein 1F [Medicago truncatula]KEH38959.1 CBF/DREB1 transcription factor [Medicago truncatula]